MKVTPLHRMTVQEAIALLVKAGVHVDQTDQQRVALANARLTRAEKFQFPDALRIVVRELEHLSATAQGSDEHLRLVRLFDRSFDL